MPPTARLQAPSRPAITEPISTPSCLTVNWASASAVPDSTNFVALVRKSPAMPVSSRTASIVGAPGALRSIRMTRLSLSTLWLPARSTAWAFSVWDPSVILAERSILKAPLASAVPVASTLPLSKMLTKALASDRPETIMVAALVMSSSDLRPESPTSLSPEGLRVLVSTTIWAESPRSLALPATSIALAFRVCEPSGSGDVVALNLPSVLVVVDATRMVPRYNSTRLAASAVPTTVTTGLLVRPEELPAPVRGTSGAVRSKTTFSGFANSASLEAMSVAMSLKVRSPSAGRLGRVKDHFPPAVAVALPTVTSSSSTRTEEPASANPATVTAVVAVGLVRMFPLASLN